MIFSLILILFYQVINGIISLFPDYSGLATEATNALDTGISALKSMSLFVPLSTLIAVLVIVITFELGLNSFKLFNWVLNKIRGSG